jgi:hypothetical protein
LYHPDGSFLHQHVLSWQTTKEDAVDQVIRPILTANGTQPVSNAPDDCHANGQVAFQTEQAEGNSRRD